MTYLAPPLAGRRPASAGPRLAAAVRVAAVAHPVAVVAGASAAQVLVAAALRWRGADVPAHVFRVGLFRDAGLSAWNNHWYGGHHVPGYGVLFPPLAALAGAGVVGGLSAIGATACFERLARAVLGRSSVLAGLWFSAFATANLAVGRLPFALGTGLGLGALLAVHRRLRVAAPALAAAATLASPLAGAMVVLGAAAVAVAAVGRTGRASAGVAVATAGAAAVPVALLAAVFPEGGTFPFPPGALAWSLLVAAAAWWLVPPAHRAVRAGAALYGLACLAAYAVPSPLGANVTRLGMVAAPLAAGVLAGRRRSLVAAAVPLLWWQLSPAVDAVARAGADPSADAAYHEPLLRFLGGRDGGPVRVEVPFTRRHWEAAHLPPRVLLARGWERQLDIGRNPLFYRPGLTAEAYHAWLVGNGVRYVALPDVELDRAARAEAALLRSAPPFLRPAWAGAHWRVWEVAGGPGLVDGPARAVRVGVDDVVVDVWAPGELLVRVRHTPLWVASGPACVRPGQDGWTSLVARGPGRVHLRATAPLPGVRPGDRGACPGAP